MSKLSNALGAGYASKRPELLIRRFDLGGHTFRVRVPLVSESDAMYRSITEPSSDRVQALFEQMTGPLEQFRGSGADGFVFTDDDVLVEGRSMREAAKAKAITEARITTFIKLLVPESPDASLDDLTYDDIEAEWPLSVQLALCEKIGEVIAPTYKESRGN